MANNPMTRKEIYLAKMAGEDVSVPEPMTREETYLKKIAENGGSGGGGVLEVLETNEDDKGEVTVWNKTCGEVLNAFPNVRVKFESDDGIMVSTVESYSYINEDGYYSIMYNNGQAMYAKTLDDYPSNEVPEPDEPIT